MNCGLLVRPLVIVILGSSLAHADPEPPAPPADQASGIEIAAPRETHPVANTMLAVPRAVALFLLEGPRYAAAEVDDYLESRSPNAFGRDVGKASWRVGVQFDWQTALGPSLGARIGHALWSHASVDAYGGLFGPRGQSGGVHANLGRFSAARIEPSLAFDAGQDLERVYAGIGELGERAGYQQRGFTAAGGVAAHAGPITFATRASYDSTRAGDLEDDFPYDPMTIVGLDERQRAATGELAVTLDTRARRTRWLPRAAPSSGTYVRAAAAYTSGEATRTGDFTLGRGTLEARQLIDLFNGDRVLSVGAMVETITTDATDVPFDRVPALGGRDHMRAFAMGQLRDDDVATADLQYEWPLGSDLRSYMFVEAGHTAAWHAGYGGGIRFVSGSTTGARVQVAGSERGDLGVFVQVGAL